MAAVTCPEVMYGAYYPYLYGRGAARYHHHHAHFQYDRFNVQSGGGSGGGGGGGGGEVYGGVSSGSASSGAVSPASPPHAHLAPSAPPAHSLAAPRLRAKEEDLSTHGRASADGGGSSESEGEGGAGGGASGGGGGSGAGGGGGRAQYVSANCVVFTHYSGDVATVVDEHFARALSVDKPKESVPMVSRNLPASFFNALAVGGGGAGAAGAGAGVGCGGVELYEYDPWQHYGGYGSAVAGSQYSSHAHAHAHAHAHGMAGYGPLLLGRGVHPQYKPVEWPHHHMDPTACAPYSYPPVPGLEAQVQDSSKDLYWF